MKETTARNIADGDLLATRLESERLSRTVEHETQRRRDSENQIKAANDVIRELQQETITLKQASFQAGLTASSSNPEAERITLEAKTMLKEFMEANGALTKKLDQFSQDNAKLSFEFVSQRDENAKLAQDLRDTKQTLSNSQQDAWWWRVGPSLFRC